MPRSGFGGCMSPLAGQGSPPRKQLHPGQEADSLQSSPSGPWRSVPSSPGEDVLTWLEEGG